MSGDLMASVAATLVSGDVNCICLGDGLMGMACDAKRHSRYEVAATELCSDCPPVGYPTDKTRCDECPRSSRNMLRQERELAQGNCARCSGSGSGSGSRVMAFLEKTV